MVTSAPTIEQRGPVFRLHWPEDGVRVRVSRIHQSSRGEMHGEISVQYSSDLPVDGRYGWRHIVGSRYQITSDRSRGEIARRCESEVSGIAWRQLIEEASINVLRRYRRGAEVLDLSTWSPPKNSPVGYRLTPLLAEGLPNMIFGDGGVGKSMVALWLSAMVTEGLQEPFECSPGNVLYLDWEMEAEEAQGRLGRIAEGMGFSTPPRVFYRRCVGRLVDDVEWLAETVQSKGIDLVVVDSAVPACGGNPNEPESVQALFYGLEAAGGDVADRGARQQERRRRAGHDSVWQRVLVEPEPQRVAGREEAGAWRGLDGGRAAAPQDERRTAAESGVAEASRSRRLSGWSGCLRTSTRR